MRPVWIIGSSNDNTFEWNGLPSPDTISLIQCRASDATNEVPTDKFDMDDVRTNPEFDPDNDKVT